MSGAQQLGNLSNLGFGMGNTITDQQMQQGGQVQAMQQALINAAKGQYGDFTGSPEDALKQLVGSLGAMPGGGGTTTQSTNPGILGILGALAGFA